MLSVAAERPRDKPNKQSQMHLTSLSHGALQQDRKALSPEKHPDECEEHPGECFSQNKFFALGPGDACQRAGGILCPGEMSVKKQEEYDAKTGAARDKAPPVVYVSSCNACQAGQCFSHNTCHDQGSAVDDISEVDQATVEEWRKSCEDRGGEYCDGVERKYVETANPEEHVHEDVMPGAEKSEAMGYPQEDRAVPEDCDGFPGECFIPNREKFFFSGPGETCAHVGGILCPGQMPPEKEAEYERRKAKAAKKAAARRSSQENSDSCNNGCQAGQCFSQNTCNGEGMKGGPVSAGKWEKIEESRKSCQASGGEYCDGSSEEKFYEQEPVAKAVPAKEAVPAKAASDDGSLSDGSGEEEPEKKGGQDSHASLGAGSSMGPLLVLVVLAWHQE